MKAKDNRQKAVANGPTSERRTNIGEVPMAMPPAIRATIAQRTVEEEVLLVTYRTPLIRYRHVKVMGGIHSTHEGFTAVSIKNKKSQLLI